MEFQKFVVQPIRRDQIKNAPYNPRKIKSRNKENLKKYIKEAGLLEPLVWNKTTGNLVGGHKRLSILDSLLNRQDYIMDIAVVELSEREERKANIQLNNPALQGEFDYAELAKMDFDFKEFDLNVVQKIDFDFGFDFSTKTKETEKGTEGGDESSEDGEDNEGGKGSEDGRDDVDTNPEDNEGGEGNTGGTDNRMNQNQVKPRKIPLAIVLSTEDYEKWCKYKEKHGILNDSDAFLKLFKGGIYGE